MARRGNSMKQKMFQPDFRGSKFDFQKIGFRNSMAA